MKTDPRLLTYWMCALAGVLLSSVGVGQARNQPAAAAGATGICNRDNDCRRMAKVASDYSHSGRWSDAKQTYEAAYARWRDPVLLFNLARVLHKSGQLDAAEQYYRQYQALGVEQPEADRRQVDDWLQGLQQEKLIRDAKSEPLALVLRKRPESAPLLLAPVSRSEGLSQDPSDERSTEGKRTERRSLSSRWWFWSSLGVVTVGIGLGVGLGIAARRPDLEGVDIIRPPSGP